MRRLLRLNPERVGVSKPPLFHGYRSRTDKEMAAILNILPSSLGKQAQRWMTPVRERISTGISSISQFVPQKARPKGAKKKTPASANYGDIKPGDVKSSGSPKGKPQLENIKKAYIQLQQTSSESAARLKSLEKMLSDEGLRHSVTLYYQLDSVWTFCHQLLVSHQKNLIREFEGKERDKMLDGYRNQQEKESRSVTDRISRLEKERKYLDADKRALIQELNAKKQIWHFFSRKALSIKLEELNKELAPIVKELHRGKNDQDNLHSTQPPKLKGLNVVTKRAINNHLIAYAQFYYSYLSANDISKLIRMVRKKSPADFNFGTYDKCRKLEQFVQEKKARMQGLKGLRKTIAPQAKRIMVQTKYKNENEAIPQISSVGFMLSINNFVDKKTENQETKSGMVNVVQDNYWDLNKLLIR